MVCEYKWPENKLADDLRRFADIADAGDKPHWAAAMRLAAEQLEHPIRYAMQRNGDLTGDGLHVCGACDGTGCVA